MAEMTVIPRDVLSAQADVISLGLYKFAETCGVSAPCPEELRGSILSSWSAVIESNPTYARGVRSRLTSDQEDEGVPSQLLLPGLNVPLSKTSLWLLGLLTCTGLVNIFLRPETADFLQKIYTVSGFFFAVPKARDVTGLAQRFDASDYPYARAAVRLSCGNPYGLTIPPLMSFTVGDLADEVRREAEGHASKKSFDESLQAFVSRCVEKLGKERRGWPGLPPDEREAVGTLIMGCCAPLRLFFSLAGNIEYPDVGNEALLNRDCEAALDRLVRCGLLASARGEAKTGDGDGERGGMARYAYAAL